jgi:hypothetical protein
VARYGRVDLICLEPMLWNYASGLTAELPAT